MAQITLTFDNGPEPEVTPAVLGALRRRRVAATFFVLGQKLLLPGRRALAERAVAEGHWLGNHTFTHSVPLGRCSSEAAVAEIAETQAAIGDLAHPDRLFRPFGSGGALGPHLLNPAAAAYLAAGGFTCVLWNVVPRDWDDPEGWPARALSECRSRPSSLVVLHDLPTGAMAHLDRFIAEAQAAGHVFRQDFPPDCVPLRRGSEVLPLAPFVAAPHAKPVAREASAGAAAGA